MVYKEGVYKVGGFGWLLAGVALYVVGIDGLCGIWA